MSVNNLHAYFLSTSKDFAQENSYKTFIVTARYDRGGGVVWRKKYIVGDLVSRVMTGVEKVGVYAGRGESRGMTGVEKAGGLCGRDEGRGMSGVEKAGSLCVAR